MAKTTLIEYVGPLRAYAEDNDPDAECVTPAPVIEIADTGQRATYGVPLEVDAAVAGGLLATDNWRIAKKTTSKETS